MFAQERHKLILETLHSKHRITNQELVELLNVSGTTVRADLSELEKAGKLVRTHGGAMVVDDPILTEVPMFDRHDTNAKEKKSIAQKAIHLVPPHSTILIDTGTTCLELARLLKDASDVTIITNDLQVAHELQKNVRINIMFLGGTIRNAYDCTLGSSVLKALSDLTIDVAFIAANAVSKEGKVSTPNLETAEVKKAMMEASQKNYLLVDHTKLERRSLCGFGELSSFDGMITNQLSNEMKNTYEKMVKIIT